MLSFPFNSSTPVFHYNKDAFKAAGLDPEKPPTTWPEVALAAAKLKASGHKCPFTTSWISWTQLESFSAWHNVLYATKNNGFGGLDTRLAFNTPLHVRHIENLANMAKSGLFVYKGRDNAAGCHLRLRRVRHGHGLVGAVRQRHAQRQVRLWHRHAALLPGRAGRAAEHRDRRRQPVGDVRQEARGIQGASPLSSTTCPSPRCAAKSHQRTGYLPVTKASFELTDKSGFYKKNPGTDVSVTQMIRKTTDKSRGVRLGNFVQIRTIIDEELEGVWKGSKQPKEALDAAVKRGNEQLERFQKANKA